jgi:hypothetical protein
MGVILCSYGDDAADHEGYAAQVLDDGSLTSTYSDDTRPKMVGQVVAACGCGWTGTTRYPERERYDEAAEELALAEWEHRPRPTDPGGPARRALDPARRTAAPVVPLLQHRRWWADQRSYPN